MIYVFFSKHPMLIVSEGNPLWWCHIPEFYNPRRGIYISWCSWEGHTSTERDWSKPHSLFELRGTKYKTSCFNSSLCRVRKIGGWEDKLVPIKKKRKKLYWFYNHTWWPLLFRPVDERKDEGVIRALGTWKNPGWSATLSQAFPCGPW